MQDTGDKGTESEEGEVQIRLKSEECKMMKSAGIIIKVRAKVRHRKGRDPSERQSRLEPHCRAEEVHTLQLSLLDYI